MVIILQQQLSTYSDKIYYQAVSKTTSANIEEFLDKD